MTNYYKKRIPRRRVMSAIRLETSGTQIAERIPVTKVSRAMRAPVIWQGEPAELYFWHYARSVGQNHTASQLINHPGFSIYGKAYVVTDEEHWYCMRVPGTKGYIQQQIDHLTLRENPEIWPANRKETHCEVVARDENVLVAVKLALP